MAHVLVVDDSPSIRELMKRILESLGHRVYCAEDGQEGLQMADSRLVDLVVTDINMPRMNGIELIRALRTRKRFTGKPILVLTTEKQAQAEAKAAGASGFGSKPLDHERFVAVVQRLLD